MLQLPRLLVMACTVTAALAAAPNEGQACNWFRSCFGHRTTYAPVVAAPVAAPPTISYVPQTTYRAVSQTVPVTTCRPVTTRDPCTGCPVTVMRPMTTYVQQTRYVPVTTYRAVYRPTCYSAPAHAPARAPSTCGTPTYTPSPVVPGSSLPATPQPSLASPPPTSTTPPMSPGAPPPTYRSEKPAADNGNGNGNGSSSNGTNGNVNPIPQGSSTRSRSDDAPRLISPTDQLTRQYNGRALHRPVTTPVAARVQTARLEVTRPEHEPAAATQEDADAEGWHTAAR